MINSESLKLQLVQTIINLPEEKLAVVRDLIADVAVIPETISNKKPRQINAKTGKKSAAKKRKAQNPMLALIGCVSYEPPLKSIDEELYGENPL